MRDQFIKTLLEMTDQDPRIMLLTGDLGFKVFDEYREKFPRNFLNVGVAEQNMTGIAAGLAFDGRIVYTYSIGNFSTLRCLEQIRNDCCYHELNVNIVSVGAGFSYGQLGISHHATEDIAIMRSLPNIVVASPGDDWETAACTRALAASPGVGYLRIDRASSLRTQREGEKFVLGQARVIRDGHDVSLIATGGMVSVALDAGTRLSRSGIDARVVSMHTITPTDVPTILRCAKETGGIVTMEEHSVAGGLGSAVAETALEAGAVPGFFYRAGLRSGFSSIVGDQDYLRGVYGLDSASIVSKVQALVEPRRARRSVENS